MKHLLLIPALCVVCFACTQNGQGEGAKNPSEANLQDWELTAQVKTAIITDDTISATARLVSVNSRDGVVTLSGKVPTKEDKDKIGEIVKAVPGVKKVDDQITVSSQ